MTQITVNVREAEVPMFLDWLMEHGLTHEPVEAYEIPEWQKAEVLNILDASKPEDFVPLEEAIAYLTRRSCEGRSE